MRRAIDIARLTYPHPNPRVGALVLDVNGEVIAAASHDGPGLVHAEVAALEMAGGRARGGTLVVTLEPCIHFGRTPPCVSAVIESGVTSVVAGAMDPDPRVGGRGFEALRQSGIAVHPGILESEVEQADPAYFHHRRTGRPLVTLKMAMTLDGQVAAADGGSRWITSIQARQDAHQLRMTADAVIVGAGTVFADDPRLTVRLDDFDGPQPVPVVVAGARPLDPGAAVFGGKALVYAAEASQLPAEVVALPGEGGVELAGMLEDLGNRGHLSLLVEGGPTLAAGLWKGRLIDRGTFYIAASVGGGMGMTPFSGRFESIAHLSDVEVRSVSTVGPDARIDFEVT